MSSDKRHLLLVMVDIDPSIDEDDFNRWYFEEHVPERLACPGFLSARRFRATEGAPRYLAIYDLEGPEALESERYRALAHSPIVGNNSDDPVGSDRTRRVLDGFRNVVRNVYVEIEQDDFQPSSTWESPGGQQGEAEAW